MITKLSVSALSLVLAQAVSAGPLTEARVNQIINEVAVVNPEKGARAAKLNDVIDEQNAVKTGIKSRSELLFQDNTLTRIGPETFFSFKPGTREMALQQGTMLLQVPKGLGGAKIRTAAVTAAITGTTIMLEHKPGKNLKVLVLEGSLRLSVNGTFGDSVLLTAGKMVIMPPDAKRIPEPVGVDLAHVVKTSSLVKMSSNNAPTLPSMPLIQREIDRQTRSVASARLVPTNLVINGPGADMTTITEVARRQEATSGGSIAPTVAIAPPVSAPAESGTTPIPPVTAPGTANPGNGNGNAGNGNNGNGNAGNGNNGNTGNGNNGNAGNGNNGNAGNGNNGNGIGNSGTPGNGNGNQSNNGNGGGVGNGGPAPIGGSSGGG
jgi:quercetin dioxygenase-like cupin family protein